MTTIMCSIFSPLSGLWSSIDHFSRVIGYSRAAAELARMGYQTEAQKCMMELKKLN